MHGDDLLAIAKRRGIIKWPISGRIEVLRYSEETGRVLARNILGEKEHPISSMPHNHEWECFELSPKTLVSLEALLAQKPKDA